MHRPRQWLICLAPAVFVHLEREPTGHATNAKSRYLLRCYGPTAIWQQAVAQFPHPAIPALDPAYCGGCVHQILLLRGILFLSPLLDALTLAPQPSRLCRSTISRLSANRGHQKETRLREQFTCLLNTVLGSRHADQRTNIRKTGEDFKGTSRRVLVSCQFGRLPSPFSYLMRDGCRPDLRTRKESAILLISITKVKYTLFLL